MTLSTLGYWYAYTFILIFLLIQLSIHAQPIVCPPDMDVGNDPGQCGAIVTYPDPDVILPYGNLEQLAGLPSGSFFEVGTMVQTYVASDGSGNVVSCSFAITVNDHSMDSDCDGVGDDCDVCPGGDDRVDNNGDGFPDCAVFPGFRHVIRDWVCSRWKKKKKKRKYLICHRRNNRRNRTLCVSRRAVRAHLAHGDFLGPCTSCGHHRDASDATIEEEIARMKLFPNPVQDVLNVELLGLDQGAVQLDIINLNGQRIWTETVENLDYEITHEILLPPNVTNGLYIIRATQNSQSLMKSMVVMRK